MESSYSDFYLLKTEVVEKPHSQPARPLQLSQKLGSTVGSSLFLPWGLYSVTLPSSRAWNSRKSHGAGTLESSTQRAISAEVAISGPGRRAIAISNNNKVFTILGGGGWGPETQKEVGFFFVFLGQHLQHMEVPRLGVKSELQLLAYTTATQDPSHFCDLHRSSQQH